MERVDERAKVKSPRDEPTFCIRIHVPKLIKNGENGRKTEFYRFEREE